MNNNYLGVKNLVIEKITSKKKEIILFIQGGPSPIKTLNPSLKNKDIPLWLIDYVKDVKTFFNTYFQNYNYAQFLQTINFKKELIEIDHLSLDDANLEIKTNIENLHQVITSYHEQNFKIILFGHSLGGLLVLNYLQTYDDKLLHKVIVANCRLNTPLNIVNNLLHNQSITILNKDGEIKEVQKVKKMSYHNLFTSLAIHRYQTTLKNFDLSKVLFVTCQGDARFGVLDESEKKFIKNRGGKIIVNSWEEISMLRKNDFPHLVTEFLAHRSVFFGMNTLKIKDFIIK